MSLRRVEILLPEAETSTPNLPLIPTSNLFEELITNIIQIWRPNQGMSFVEVFMFL